MSGIKRGFTLIEVALFLVITGALFFAITIGVRNSIYQQRFNDAVQNFADFLRNTYSEVINVQNIGGGRSEKAIYGKLISFGESKTTSATDETINTSDSKNVVYSYSVIGDVEDYGSGSALDMLKKLKANVVTVQNGKVEPIGIIENYVPKWSSQIEPACNGNDCSYDPFKGAILIVRHPSSGIVYTFVKKESLEINSKMAEANLNFGEDLKSGDSNLVNQAVNSIDNLGILNLDGFESTQLDLCVNPEPGMEYSMRRDVRIKNDARNTSGVIIVDDENSKCVEKE